MGLDISVISQIKPISIPEGIELWSNEYYEWEEKQDIEGSVWNFQPNTYFREQSEGLPDGFGYGTGEEYSFRAGSYSGYGEWRDLLARLALDMGSEGVWNKIDSGEGYSEIPFSEVINFSDADGVIGPVASKKLYNDFVNYEKDIIKKLDRYYLKFEDFEIDGETYDWFKHKYKDWKEAFRIASNNGAVIFH